jgi:uncharacterized protein (DUF1684 family)
MQVLRTPRTAVAVLALAAACTAAPDPGHIDVETWRATKDEFMRSSPESPVPPDQRATFKPLAYYPVDLAYQVPASLTVIESTDILEMPTSTGLRRQMRRIGTLSFTLQGQPLALTAFVDATERDMRRLFVPFGDLTNGMETYTGGRYLDLDRTATNIYDLDFNRAYFPFCYYNPKYDCPLPPKENKLKIPVRAGEKIDPANPKAE